MFRSETNFISIQFVN